MKKNKTWNDWLKSWFSFRNIILRYLTLGSKINNNYPYLFIDVETGITILKFELVLEILLFLNFNDTFLILVT